MALYQLKRNFARLRPNSILYEKVKNCYFELFKKHNYMALALRFAWHDAGTFDAKTRSGGPDGSIRFDKEMSHNANRGLEFARERLLEVKEQFKNATYADLIQVGGYSAVEYCNGPKMPFSFGRADALDDSDCPPEGRLPSPLDDALKLKILFGRFGFRDIDIVALSGGHTIGRVYRKEGIDWDGPWTNDPDVFNNSYFVELLNKNKTGLVKLPSDLALIKDTTMRYWVEAFAKDNDMFLREYTNSHVKLSQLGNN